MGWPGGSAESHYRHPSMKVPPKRKGNECPAEQTSPAGNPLNESPSEKEGKFGTSGNHCFVHGSLNESPSEKEGK